MSKMLQRIKRIPGMLTHGLFLYHVLQYLGSMGLLIRPFYFCRETFGDEPASSSPPQFEDFTLVELEPRDMDQLDRIDHRGYTADDLRQRLVQDHLCLALKHEGKVAAFTWCNLKEIQFEPCRRPLKPGEAYLYDAHTLEAYRGRHLAPYLRRQCYMALRAKGCHALYSTSDCLNRSAVRFKQKLRAQFLYLAVHVKLFGKWQKTWIVRRYA